MANIKKYNPETQSWETWASSSATGVYSVNPELLPEEEQAISVEDALIRDREDIELMKKNISWLALHGGGGSGGGGGDSTGENIRNWIEVYDANNNVSKNIVWRKTSKSLNYSVLSEKASNLFEISISLDGRNIANEKGVAAGRIMSINLTLKSNNTNRHVLTITAKDSYDNLVRDTIDIVELALSVSATNVNRTYNVDISEILTTGTLSVNCRSSIPDDYILYWGTKSDLNTNVESRRGNTQLTILSAITDYQITIPYWSDDESSRLLNRQDVQVGQNLMFFFVLVSKSDPSVISEVLEVSSTIVSPDTLAIKPLSLSTNFEEITKISKVGVLNCNFVVYLNTNSFQYDYTVDVYKLEQDQSTGNWIRGAQYPSLFRYGIGKYKDIVTIMYNNLHRDDFFEPEGKYEFVIYAEDKMNRTKTGTTSCFAEIQPAMQTEIDLGQSIKEAKIFDFNIRDSVPNSDWVWTYENPDYRQGTYSRDVVTNLTFYNMGGKSKVNTTHCRLTNKAHAVINASTVNGQVVPWFPSDTSSGDSGLIWASGPQFTLSISYYNDFTPDDNRTIFNFGNYVPKTSTSPGYGQGILINNHDFYIMLGTTSNLITGKIQDSIYHQIDIVFGRNNFSTDASTDVEVYHNGVLTALGKDIAVSDIYTLFKFNEMSIGCRKVNNSKTQYTNLSLQSVSLYGTAFNPYQIVCNYINHLVAWQLNENNELNTDLLNRKVRSNLIVEKEGDKYSCAVWDKNSNSFGTEMWIEKDFGKVRPNETLWKNCPIPIIILDFSDVQSYAWDLFRQSWENRTINPVNVPMYYFNPLGNGAAFENQIVQVSVQGTTSITYAIKNLTIDFGQQRMFWVKQDWFPERYYTLKADIVDSAHINNACIGKFVNACAQNANLLNPTPPMSYFNENKESNTFSDLPQIALDDGGVSIKHTLEGFPVLVLGSFIEIDGSISNRSLGIYSFNLGREAYHNMGFELLKRFRDVSGNVLSKDAMPPLILGAPNEDEDVMFFDAECWEGKISLNCRPKTANTEAQINENTGNQWNGSVNAKAPVELNGYFWSSRPNHIFHFWDKKYPEDRDITCFQNFCSELVALPYVKGGFNTGNTGNVFEYDWDGTKMIVPNQTQGGLTIHRTNADSPFNPKNASFYYVICMLFGMVDSLGKNLSMRIWNKNQQDSQWYTCFYDMDTALGIDNIGSQKVDPDVLDETLTNNPEISRNFIVVDPTEIEGNSKMYTVKDNKLWGIIDHDSFKDQVIANAVQGVNSMYAHTWNMIRTNYLKSADDFMEVYFNNQASGIGEILYNQDFDVKYINTPQFHFMYGDRKAFVKDWITKRIKFLDGYFGYIQREKGGNNIYLESTDVEDCSYNNRIQLVHQSGEEYLPVISNSPCVITSTIQNESNKYSYYLPANTPVQVRFTNAPDTPGIQTWINNSDLLLDIQGLTSLKVSGMSHTLVKSIPEAPGGNDLYSMQMGTLSGFTKFNMAGNRAFNNDAIDFIKLFKTWNEGENTLPYALTELNLSNTKSDRVTQFSLNLTSPLVGPNGEKYYQNPFENLTDIDISYSCVTSVLLPRNIALNTLDVRGSSIQNLALEGQSVLKTIDFSDCIALRTISLNDCSAFETFRAENLPQLESVTIGSCPSLSEVYIDLNGSTTPVTIQIGDVPNLKKVTILNAYNADSQVSIIADNLEQLILTGCKFESIDLNLNSEGKSTLKFVNISSSSVKLIRWNADAFTGDYLDLSNCPHLVEGGISMANNKAIEKIQLPNIEESPVTINFSFSGCSNLTRIYGNLLLTQPSMFKGCSKFTIHGGKFKQGNTLQNIKMSSGLYYYLADVAVTNKCLKDEFQEGNEVTNMTIKGGLISSGGTARTAESMFEGTSVDTFDVYYALRHLDPYVTNISSMFAGCSLINTKITSSGIDNSPHWTMFDKCGNVTNVSSLFLDDTNMGPFRVYGNHLGEYSDAHQGLFTPLKNCKNFNKIFGVTGSVGNAWFIADKNTFVPKEEGSYFGGRTGTANLTNFRPKDIYTDLNKMTGAEAYKAYNSPKDVSMSGFERGNIKGFLDGFYRLPSSIEYIMDSLRYLNFNEDKMITLPIEVTSIENCFSGSETVGTAVLQRLFTRNPDTNTFDVTKIVSCFKDTNQESGNANATWQLTDTALEGFTKLSTFSSVFLGLNKKIVGSTFPYHIFDPCASRITNVGHFFDGAYHNDGLLPYVDIPGDLFKSCVNLTSISGCFANFKIQFNLTPNSFINCPKLSNVSNLFVGTTVTCLSGMPHNFFNLGFSEDIIQRTGTNMTGVTLEFPENSERGWLSNNDYQVRIEDGDQRITRKYRYLEADQNDNSVIICTPLSKYSEQIETKVNGTWQITTPFGDLVYVKELSEWEPETVNVPRRIPKQNISNMSSMFSDSNVLASAYDNGPEKEGGLDYQHLYTEEGDVEPNPDYCPFEYVYEDGAWIKAKRDDHKKTFMWAFDGVWYEELRNFDRTDYLLDDEPTGETFVGGNGQFLCPPDLLRWCIPNPTLTGLFSRARCHGRIPPYLLKPVFELKSAENMFFNCGTITTYEKASDPGKFITIPPTFFTYVPKLVNLSSMFAHTTQRSNPNVFDCLRGNGLTVDSIFYAVHWELPTGTQNSANKFQLFDVFKNNKIVSCKSAFDGSYVESYGKQYIQFNNMFSTDNAKHPLNADGRVFYGYYSSAYVTHENPKTCGRNDPTDAQQNYKYLH